jgi:hypothetical protein
MLVELVRCELVLKNEAEEIKEKGNTKLKPTQNCIETTFEETPSHLVGACEYV